jgi:hypothetical protein
MNHQENQADLRKYLNPDKNILNIKIEPSKKSALI